MAFRYDDMKLRYQNGLRAEVHKRKVDRGMKGQVNEVLREWESIVKRVAKSEVGDDCLWYMGCHFASELFKTRYVYIGGRYIE